MKRSAQALPSPGPLREAGDRPPRLQRDGRAGETRSESGLGEDSAGERRKSRDAALKKNEILQAHQPDLPRNPLKANPAPGAEPGSAHANSTASPKRRPRASPYIPAVLPHGRQ